MKVRVISFHHISSNVSDSRTFPGITTPYGKFLLLILMLKLSGYKFCTFDEIPRYPGRKIIVLNFDDAYHSVLNKAFPVLNFFGIKAHVCITGESLTCPVRGNKLKLMNKEEAKFLQDKGWNFINHTMNHTALIEKSEDELKSEIHVAARMFKKTGLKINPDYFCPPEGRVEKRTNQFILKAGYKYILTIREDIWETDSLSVFIPRINISSQKLWYAFYKICFKYSYRKNREITNPPVLDL
jgi:peptidoglycan/xylan/chitin deacetylase (PgdA/CDA1 family)